MNNEPVAIVRKMTTGGMDNFPIERFVRLKEGTLLYTSPQIKELSFEEMLPIAEKHLGHAIGLYNWKIFADAILRKAQEK